MAMKIVRGLEHLCYGVGLGAGAVHPGEFLGRPESPFQYLKVQETCRRTLYKGME